jgi:uncharacterized protein (TIGR03083 family)
VFVQYETKGKQLMSQIHGRAGTLVLSTQGRCDLDPEHLLHVFAEQRRRFVAVLEAFGPDDWTQPTRCAVWCAHDVVRHLCDGTAVAAGVADHSLDVSAGFDPRTSPLEWLAESATESPEETLARLVTLTEQLLMIGHDRLAQSIRFDVQLPYGPMDWTVFLHHVYWDSWIHERDVLLARQLGHPTDDDATMYATAYGVFLAASVASMFGDPVRETLELGGDGGGVFALDDLGAVTLTVSRARTAGPPAADVADALAGRSPIADVLGDVPTRRALAQLSEFFNTPVIDETS